MFIILHYILFVNGIRLCYNEVMAKKAKYQPSGTIKNRRARFDYQLGDTFLAGIELNGREVKALRLGHGNLRGAFVSVNGGELYLNNAQITGTNGVPIPESEQTRQRKLLLKQKEIDALVAAKQQGMHIIPTEILTKTRFIKIRISLAKSKKQYDKRSTIKKREDDINTQRELKYR